MGMTRTLKLPSDRTMSRAIVPMAAIFVVGAVLLGVLYFLDQYRDPGPSLPDRAIQAAEEAVRQSPNSVNVRFALAEMYATKGRYADAIQQYDEILKVQADAVGVLLGRGRAEQASGKLDAAAADFQKVVDQLKGAEMANTDPNLEAAYYQLGTIALQRGDAKGAIELATKATRINETDADALALLGNAQVQAGDATTGITNLQRALSFVPVGWCDPYQGLVRAFTSVNDASGVQYSTGMIALCEKRFDEAKTQLSAVTSGSHARDALIGLGLLGEQQMDYTAAAAAYKEVLAQDPKNFAATTGLARVNGATAPDVSASPSQSGGN